MRGRFGGREWEIMLLLLPLLFSSLWIRRFDMLPVALYYIETTLDIEHDISVVRVRQWAAYLKTDKAPRDFA